MRTLSQREQNKRASRSPLAGEGSTFDLSVKMRPIANLVETALVLLCTVWLISGQKCGNDTCFILSTDAAKTLFQSFEDVQLYGRCAARCVVEVGFYYFHIHKLNGYIGLQILGADFRRLVSSNYRRINCTMRAPLGYG